MIYFALLLLGPIVPGQLQQALPLHHRGVLWERVGASVSQEVQVKAGLRVLNDTNQGHPHDLLVELDARLGRFDSDHGVVESIVGGVGGSSNILILTTDKLHPVAIWILCKSDIPHPTLGEFLLERVTGILDPLACGLDVVDRDSKVTKPTVRLSVAIGHAVVRVILGAVVVGELEDGIAVGPMAVALERGGAVVREEVKRKLVLGKVKVLDLIEAQEFVEFHCTGQLPSRVLTDAEAPT